MKVLTASAFAFATLIGIGSVSACEDYYEQLALAAATPVPVAETVSPEIRQMALAYLAEIAEEQRIS